MMDNESITMKIEVKDELFNEDFDVSEKVGIELITSKEFDQNHILNVSNHTQKSSSMSVIIEPFASTSSSTSEIPKSKLPNFSIFQKAFSNHTQKCSSMSEIIETVASASHSTSEIPETKASKRDMNGEKEYFDLPYGWTKQVVYLRNQPSMKGKVRTDIYLTSPGSPSVKRKWIQSDIQLQKYLAENPNVKCDQSVTTTSRKKHREFLEELKKKSLTGGILEKSKDINRKWSNLMILDSRETSISKIIQTEDNTLVDKCKSYVHKSASRNISAKAFQCPYCDTKCSQKANLYHHVKQKHQENYGNWKLTKSKFYVSNYDRNQSLWKIYGENQDIPEWSICLDCVPHKVLKDGDDSMDKHFAENPEHYQINPAWFYLKFNLYVSDIAKQQKYKAIIKSSIICETAKEKFRQEIQVQNVAA